MGVKTNLVVDQGASFQHILYITDDASNPYNLTGYSASSQIKRWYSSLTSKSFTCTINAEAGSVLLSLTPAQSSNIVSGQYVYDVMVTDPANNVTRVVEGTVFVTPGVTNLTIETTPVTYNPNTDFTVIPLNG